MKREINWPQEVANSRHALAQWQHVASNISLDFHGDPIKAPLVVFSDGNHHMALQVTLEHFLNQHPAIDDVFYVTTPPNILIRYLEKGGLQLGNLQLSRMPHVFISPENVMRSLVNKGFIDNHQPFMQSNGNVLLVHKGNPKQITGIVDLLRDDVRLFISNPESEQASYQVYRDTMTGLAQEQGLDAELLAEKLTPGSSSTVFGECIHHREIPQALHGNHADVAMVYYHLALRYVRIFPGAFDFIPLGGSKELPAPGKPNLSTTYHAALMKDSGDWGQLFIEFLLSEATTDIYASHGLKRPSATII
ncbi:molybdate ABC transporter substrate-binding protein [Kaarinaea lacus]